MNPCPSADQLQDYLGEQLEEAARAAVEAHVEVCASCQVIVAHLVEVVAPTFHRPEQRPAAPLPATDARFLKHLTDALPSREGPELDDPDEPPTAIQFPGPPTAWGPLGQLGEYHIIQELGRGGMGVVFQALDERLNHLVAIKILKPALAALEGSRLRFEREGRRAAAVKHDHIVAVYHAGSSAEFALPYLVMEYIDGEALSRRLQRQGIVPPIEAARIVRQVALGLAAAHARTVIHRDIKPANIMLERGSGRVKITDFGLAWQTDAATVQSSHSGIAGTPAYMSPEQIRSPDRIDSRTDLFSLGVVLYELLTGERPFRGVADMILLQVIHEEPRPPRRLNPRIPRDLETICLKCLAKEPAKRYASADILAEDLRRFLAGEPIQARPVTRLERAWRWCRRNPALAAASALAALALVLTVVVAVGFGLYQASAKERIQIALADAQRERARLARYQGYTLYEQGKLPSGMLWLARALELAPAPEEDFRQEIRGQLRGWYHQLRPLRAVLALPRSDISLDFRVPQTQRTQTFSPNGRLVLTGGPAGRVWLGEVATGQLLREFLPHHAGAVTAVAFSSDGTTAITGSGDGTARLWDVATGQPRGAPLVHGAILYDVAFSPDGKLVLTGGSDETAQLWDVATGQPHGPRLRHDSLINRVAFSPDGHLALTASWDRTAQLWETASGRRHGPRLKHQGRIEAVAFSPDGKLVATGSSDATVRLWETASGKPATAPLRHQGPVQFVAFSPDGRLLLTGSLVGSAQLWEVPGGKPRGEPLVHQGMVLAGGFSPDGRIAVTGSADGTARLWDTGTGRPLGPPLPHPKSGGGVWGVAFSPDGRFILTRTETEARLWEVGTAQPAVTFPHAHWVGAVAFSPDGQRIATGTAAYGGEARQWDAHTGEPIGPALPHRLPITAIAYSPGGSRLATGSGNPWSGPGEARLWDPATAQAIGPPLRHRRAVVAIAFSPDGRTLLTGSRDKTAKLWDTTTGRLVHTYSHSDGILAVAFSTDGTTILLGTEDHLLLRRRVASGEPVGQPFRHPAEVAAVAVSPDGKTVLTGCKDHGLRLWDLESGALRWARLRHGSWVRAVAFSPDGQQVVSASGDGTAQLWETATGRPWGPPLRHQGMILSVAFRPDGGAVLTGGVDQTARLWEVKSAPLEGTAERIALWTEVVTGLELDANGEEQALDAAAWQQRCRRLEELGGPPVH